MSPHDILRSLGVLFGTVPCLLLAQEACGAVGFGAYHIVGRMPRGLCHVWTPLADQGLFSALR
jgi:hypothetical protein